MAGGPAGGILRLLDVVEEHRPALRFDFRDRFHLALDEVGDTFTYGEALDLVEGLRATLGTRTHAAAADWKYPATRADLSLQTLELHYANVHRDPKTHARPFAGEWPWRGEDEVTDEEREALTEQLIRRSALAALP